MDFTLGVGNLMPRFDCYEHVFARLYPRSSACVSVQEHARLFIPPQMIGPTLVPALI